MIKKFIFILIVCFTYKSFCYSVDEPNIVNREIIKMPSKSRLMKMFKQRHLTATSELEEIVERLAGQDMDVVSLLMARDAYIYQFEQLPKDTRDSLVPKVIRAFNKVIKDLYKDNLVVLDRYGLFFKEDLLD